MKTVAKIIKTTSENLLVFIKSPNVKLISLLLRYKEKYLRSFLINFHNLNLLLTAQSQKNFFYFNVKICLQCCVLYG